MVQLETKSDMNKQMSSSTYNILVLFYGKRKHKDWEICSAGMSQCCQAIYDACVDTETEVICVGVNVCIYATCFIFRETFTVS